MDPLARGARPAWRTSNSGRASGRAEHEPASGDAGDAEREAAVSGIACLLKRLGRRAAKEAQAALGGGPHSAASLRRRRCARARAARDLAGSRGAGTGSARSGRRDQAQRRSVVRVRRALRGRDRSRRGRGQAGASGSSGSRSSGSRWRYSGRPAATTAASRTSASGGRYGAGPDPLAISRSRAKFLSHAHLVRCRRCVRVARAVSGAQSPGKLRRT